jgi:hypothetical protein
MARSATRRPGGVKRAKLFGRCEPQSGAEPFGRLVENVLTFEPLASARRVFWIVDNAPPTRAGRRPSGSKAPGRTCAVSTFPHASRLNQEILFWIVHRNVLRPNDLDDLATIDELLLAFGRHDGADRRADPSGEVTRADLDAPLDLLDRHATMRAA